MSQSGGSGSGSSQGGSRSGTARLTELPNFHPRDWCGSANLSPLLISEKYGSAGHRTEEPAQKNYAEDAEDAEAARNQLAIFPVFHTLSRAPFSLRIRIV